MSQHQHGARDRAGTEGRLVKLALVGAYSALTLGAGVARRRRDVPSVSELVVVGLASHRVGRMLAFERVGEPFREPFTATVPDESGADDTVVARGRGVRWVVGELVSCPTCVATWAALAMSLMRRFAPGPTSILIGSLATAGVAEVVNGLSERLEWTARAARRDAGDRS